VRDERTRHPERLMDVIEKHDRVYWTLNGNCGEPVLAIAFLKKCQTVDG
jgi:hypothetical protein